MHGGAICKLARHHTSRQPQSGRQACALTRPGHRCVEPLHKCQTYLKLRTRFCSTHTPHHIQVHRTPKRRKAKHCESHCTGTGQQMGCHRAKCDCRTWRGPAHAKWRRWPRSQSSCSPCQPCAVSGAAQCARSCTPRKLLREKESTSGDANYFTERAVMSHAL